MSNHHSRSSPVAPAEWREVAELLETDRWAAAIERLRRLARETGCCEVRITLGALLAEREQVFEAIRLWTAVIEDASRAGQRAYLSAAFQNLACVYRELGDHDLAARFQQRAMQFQDDFGPEELLQLANDALAASRCDVADALLSTAADLADEEDPLQATLTATAAVSCGLQGDLRNAIGLLRIAYRQHVSLREEHAAGCDLLNIAAVLRRTGRFQLECKCLTGAARHFAQANTPQRRSQALARRRQARKLLAMSRSDHWTN